MAKRKSKASNSKLKVPKQTSFGGSIAPSLGSMAGPGPGGPGPGGPGPGGPGPGGPGPGGPGPGGPGPGGPGPGSLGEASSSQSSSSQSSSIPTPYPQTPPPTGWTGVWTVNFINQSTIVPDAEFQAGLAALQKQVDQHFTPVWNIKATVQVATSVTKNPTIWLLDNTDTAGDLGYHDINDTSMPIGFVFAQTAKDDGDTWQAVASHELLELIVDPYVNLAAQGQYAGSPAFFSYECCDGVEGDGGYTIDGVPVANFVFPSWFINNTSRQYDYLNTVDAPFTLGSGGTLAYFRAVGKWIYVTNNALLPTIHPRLSRRWRRERRTDPTYGEYAYSISPRPHVKDKR